jgi:hypothetical protein
MEKGICDAQVQLRALRRFLPRGRWGRRQIAHVLEVRAENPRAAGG